MALQPPWTHCRPAGSVSGAAHPQGEESFVRLLGAEGQRGGSYDEGPPPAQDPAL